jgi:hypothetical protein
MFIHVFEILVKFAGGNEFIEKILESELKVFAFNNIFLEECFAHIERFKSFGDLLSFSKNVLYSKIHIDIDIFF